MTDNVIFDIIVIGGGIAGINTALKLSNNKSVLLLDERRYWGGEDFDKISPPI